MAPTTRSKGLKAKKVARLKQTSEASFSPLPPELKTQIFGFLDSVSAVTALSSTSRTFNSIWKINANQICDAIVQRTVESPVEAKALIDAQRSTWQTKDNQNLEEVQRDQHGYQQAVRRLQQYLTNDDMASLALASFERKLLRWNPLANFRASTERGPFIQAYYRSRVLILSSTDEIPSSLIAPWSMLEYRRVYEILECIYDHQEYTQMGAIVLGDIVSEEESETVLEGSRGLFSRSEVALYRFELLEDHLFENFPEIYPSGLDNQPLRFFTIYELDAKTTDKLRSVPLADYLPRLPFSLCANMDLDDVLGRLQR